MTSKSVLDIYRGVLIHLIHNTTIHVTVCVCVCVCVCYYREAMEHAVMQLKYVTMNPNAPAVFYQCADISITK